jgi:hypothetical protein
LTFKAGQTFLSPIAADQTAHLWVIATAPNESGQFAIVNLTSLRGAKDQTVILRKGEHPFVKWDTCVNYALAEISSSGVLEANLARGLAKIQEDVSAEILRYIVDGFNGSQYTKNRVRDFVREAKKLAKSERA